MASVTVDDPDDVKKATVDDRGRVYLGREFIGDRVRVVVERIEE